MGYVTPEAIEEARKIDLLTYLKNYAPHELVRVSSNTDCTRQHDSLKISNGKWFWFSQNIGGHTALDYLIEVKGYTLPAAVELLLGRTATQPPKSYKQKDQAVKKLLLPPRADNNKKVKAYLISRGIHPEILDYCFENNLIFESLPYHNAVFVGYDEDGIPRYGALRGTTGHYKGEATGSDKHFSFSIHADENCNTVHVFESAIDLLSYGTMEFTAGRDWKGEHLLSLAGVFQIKRKEVVPIALERFLNLYPNIQCICLHLDNDNVGRSASEGIILGLKDRYLLSDVPPARGKDMNEALLLSQSGSTYNRGSTN